MAAPINELARAFADGMREALSAEQWDAMRARNATPEYGGGICASHDFVDANEIMDSAFLKVTGREIMAEGAEEIADADLTLWGLAWGVAKVEYFTEKDAI